MDQLIVPTSPKSPDRQLRDDVLKPPHRWWRRLGWLAVVAVWSALVVVSVLLGLRHVPSSWPVLGNLNWRLATGQLLDQNPSVIIESDSTPLDQRLVLQTVRPVYSAAPTLEAAPALLGNAVALTHDGWMVAPTSMFTASTAASKPLSGVKGSKTPAVRVATPTTHVVLLADGTVAPIHQTLPDPVSGLTFFQIDGTLPQVVELLPANTALDQSWLSIVQTTQTGHTVFGQQLAGIVGQQLLHSTTVLSQWQVIGSTDAAALTGAAVFRDSRTCAGLLDADHHLIPAAVISGALTSILDTGVLNRSEVAVDYALVSQLTATERQKRALPDTGILVVDNHQLDSTDPPAADQTVLPGDVIKLIDNQFVDEQMDLARVVHAVPAGTVLYLTVVRDGQDKAVQWTL